MRARTWLDEQLSQLIQIERSRPMGKSFFNALVNGRDDEGKAMSDSDLVDNLRLLTFAGHETTASVLAWVVITLASRPELWQRLCDEVDKGASMPTSPQDLRAFPFAEALFRETLRVYPIVAMTGRKTTTEVTIAHHRVPSGVLVNIPLSLLMSDPEIFPEPSRFDPDRWLGRREPPTLLEIAQFGGGPHFCLGYHLALMESVQLLVALAQRMAKDGLRPRLADGKAPQHRYLPLGHPTGATVIDFV